MRRSRRVELPAQFFAAEKLRLGMRLPAATVLRTLNASKNYITFQTSECSIDCLG